MQHWTQKYFHAKTKWHAAHCHRRVYKRIPYRNGRTTPITPRGFSPFHGGFCEFAPSGAKSVRLSRVEKNKKHELAKKMLEK